MSRKPRVDRSPDCWKGPRVPEIGRVTPARTFGLNGKLISVSQIVDDKTTRMPNETAKERAFRDLPFHLPLADRDPSYETLLHAPALDHERHPRIRPR
jgi:hypothetical protein